MCPFHDDFSHFFRIYQNKEVARCCHGYCSYAPLSDIVEHQNQCTIPSSSRICIQISFTYPALPKPLSRPLFPFCLSTIRYGRMKPILAMMTHTVLMIMRTMHHRIMKRIAQESLGFPKTVHAIFSNIG